MSEELKNRGTAEDGDVKKILLLNSAHPSLQIQPLTPKSAHCLTQNCPQTPQNPAPTTPISALTHLHEISKRPASEVMNWKSNHDKKDKNQNNKQTNKTQKLSWSKRCRFDAQMQQAYCCVREKGATLFLLLFSWLHSGDGTNKGVSQIRMHLPRLYFERWAVLFSKKLPNMSTGIALLLTLISYTQNPTGWVYATGNYLSVIQGLSNLQPWETLNSTARLFWAVIFIIDGHLWHCYSCVYCQ